MRTRFASKLFFNAVTFTEIILLGANSSDFNDTQRPYAGMFCKALTFQDSEFYLNKRTTPIIANRSGQEQRPVDERQQALPFFDRPPRRQFASASLFY